MSGQVVNLTINITDGNAAEAVQQVVGQLNAIGPAGETAGAAAGAGLDQIGEHALSARENVRLLNDDLGLRIPRAMQAAIMQSQMLTGAISMIGPGLIAMGGIDILGHMVDMVEKGYDKWVLMKDEIAAAADAVKLFGEMSSRALEQQRAAQEHYIQVTQGSKAAGQFKANNLMSDDVVLSQIYGDEKWKKAPEEITAGFQRITGSSIAPMDLDTVIGRLQKYEDKQKEILATAQQLPANTGGVLQVSANDLMKDQQRVDLGSAMLKGLTDKRDAIVAELNSVYADVDKAKPGTEADQQRAEKEKATQSALKDLDEKALESQLSGLDLLDAQRKHAEADWVQQHGASAAAMADIDAEYAQKYLDWMDKQAQETEQKNAKIVEAQKQFDQTLDQVETRSDDAQVTGYARIADEAERSVKRIQDAFAKLKATPGVSPQAIQDAQMLGTADTGDVYNNMLREMGQLHTKTMDQIAKEEEQTARETLAPWQQAALKIQDEWQDKVRAIDESEDQQLTHVKQNSDAAIMIEQEGGQKRVAAYQLMNAQMQHADEETRDKLANGLQSLFSNPEQFFEKRAMDTAFQMMANEMLTVFKSSSPTGGMLQYIFGMGPQMSTSTNPLTDMKSALGLGDHLASGTATSVSPAMISFQNGSTTLLTGSQALLTAASSLQSAAGSMAFGGGTVGMGSTNFGGGTGGFGGDVSGMMGETGGGSSQSVAGVAPSLSLAGGGGSYMTAAGNSVIDASSLSAAGSGVSSSLASAGGSGKGLGAAMGIAGGALMAGTSIYSAYENSNPVAGLVGGAMGGMEAGAALGSIVPGLGTLVGGAIGAAVGGVTGLLAGIFGDQGKGQAEGLDVNTVQPTLLKDMQDYEAGRSGYNSLSTELSSLLISSQNSTSQMGSGARNYFNSNIAPEINAAILSLQKQEIGGRGNVTMSGAQYHTGGWVGDFGDLSTGPDEGFAKLLASEFVVQPAAAQSHGPLLSAINSGNVSYASSVQPRMPASSGSGASVNLTIQAIDSQSVSTWARGGGGRALVAAINQAQGQYSGRGRG